MLHIMGFKFLKEKNKTQMKPTDSLKFFFKIPGINGSLIINFLFFKSFWRNPKNWLFLWIKIRKSYPPPQIITGQELAWAEQELHEVVN